MEESNLSHLVRMSGVIYPPEEILKRIQHCIPAEWLVVGDEFSKYEYEPEIEEAGETEMSTANLFIDGLKTIGVIFLEDRNHRSQRKVYTYKTLEDFEVGNHAVVVVEGNDPQTKIVEVVRVDEVADLKEGIRYKWAVQKIDYSAWNSMKQREAAFEKNIAAMRRQAAAAKAKAELVEALGLDGESFQKSVDALNGKSEVES